MPAREIPTTAFTDDERRIITAALVRHADALEAFYADAAAGNGEEAERLRLDAILARALLAAFTA